MNNECEKIKDKIADFISGILPDSEVINLHQHLDDCSACNEYIRALKDEDKLLTTLFAEIDMNMEVRQERVLNEINRSGRFKQYKTIPILMQIMKNRITKFAAAAVIITAVSIMFHAVSDTPSWGQVVEAFNQVQNVYLKSIIKSDNREIQLQLWLKRPNCLRIESQNRVIIDNGNQRLLINHKTCEARLGQSWNSFEPLEENTVFQVVNWFRSKDTQALMGFEAVRLAEESNEQTIVYEIHNEAQTGKAWVESRTMLPQRIFLSKKDINTELFLRYEPIEEEIFSTAIPDGYKELPYLEHLRLSGTVIDESGEPVAGAVVYETHFTAAHHTTITHTDKDGKFSMEILPDGNGGVLFPVFLRAFKINEPNHVAWMLLEDPDNRRKLGGSIAGEPGQIEFIDDQGNKKFGGAKGIVMQMTSAATVSGTVTDNEGKPIDDATVSIRCSLSGQDNMPLYPFISLGGSELAGRHPAVKTDFNGFYHFTNLPEFWDKCSFGISAHKKGYVVTDNTEKNIECPFESETSEIRMYKTGVRITGRVINNFGEPLIGYYVASIVDEAGANHGTERTDEKGRFELTECPIVPDYDVRVKLLGSLNMGWNNNKSTKDEEFVFYPDTEVKINYEPGKLEYEGVEIIAVKPDIKLEIELKNSDSQPVRYFPVEVRSEYIDFRWGSEKFTARTDEQGKCIIKEIPQVGQLTIRLNTWKIINGEKLTEEQIQIVKENKKYKGATVPVKLTPGKKTYKISYTLLTHDQ